MKPAWTQNLTGGHPLETPAMRLLLTTLLILTVTQAALAQKAPETGYLYPPVVKAGTTTAVQVGGYDLTPDVEFFLQDERVQLQITGGLGEFIIPPPPYWFGEKGSSPALPLAREFPAMVTVPADHPGGLVRWQVANANGPATAGVFFVSHGNIVPEERDRDFPQVIPQLPAEISGRISRIAEIDRYQFTFTQAGPITVKLLARQLATHSVGGNWNGVIRVTDSNGKMITDVVDTEGRDCALTFAALANVTYTVHLHDLDYRGDPAYVYCLAITPGPRVVATIPAAGQRGEAREVTFLGYGVASGTAQLETVTQSVTFPADPQQKTMRHLLQTPHGNTPVEIPLSDLTELATVENNTLPGPCALTQLMPKDGVQKFTFTATTGQQWRLAAESFALGTGLDLSLAVQDGTGKQLIANDDQPGNPDPGLIFTVPADGVYTVVVTDLSGRAGELDALYRLALELPTPGFTLSITPQQLSLPVAGKGSLKVAATLLGGFKEEITLQVAGLPAGITVPAELKIPAGQAAGAIEFTVAETAPTWAGMITVTGTAKVGETMLTQTATAPAGGNLAQPNPQAATTTKILLATTLKPAYTVELVDRNRQRAVHRGTTYPAPFLIKRNEGFTGEVQLLMQAQQARHRQGITAPMITVPPEAGEALFPCIMPEWLETDRTTRMVVLGMALQPDPTGKLRYVTQPADARVTMILEGALLKLSHEAGELTVQPGDSFAVPVTLSRSVKLTEPVLLELVVPPELRDAFTCAAATLAPDQTSHTLSIQSHPHPRLTGRWTLQLRATTIQEGRWPVVSLTEFPVDFTSATDQTRNAAE